MKRLSLLLIFVLAFAASALGAQITVSSVSIENWTFGGSAASIRINPNKTFVSSTGQTIPVGSITSFYKTVNCTVSGTTVSCPSFTIASTTDSSQPTARYTAYLYDSRGAMRLVYLKDFRIPSSPTSTTWAAIRSYNEAGAVTLPSTYYTADQTNALLNNYYNSSAIDSMLANVLASGVSANRVWASPDGTSGAGSFRALAASDIPALSAAKITSGEFSTVRIADDAVTYSKLQNVSAGRILGNSTGSAANAEEISIGSNLSLSGGVLSASGGVAYESFVSNYADFATAVSSLSGAGNQAILAVNTPENCSSAIVVPSYVFLKIIPGAPITESGTCTITFQGAGISPDIPRVNLFSQFEAGDITFSGVLPDDIYPEWFGATCNDSSDDLAAFQRMIAAIPDTRSAHIVLASGCNYDFSDTWDIDAHVFVEGQSSDGWFSGASLTFAENKTGIRIHHENTLTGSNTRDGVHSKFENFAILATPGTATTHTVSTNGLTVTKTAGADFSDASGHHQGNTITINGYPYMIDAFGSAATVTIKKPRLMVTAIAGTPYVYIADYRSVPTGADWVGASVTINGGTYTISDVEQKAICSSSYYRLTLSGNYSGSTNQTTNVCFADGGGSTSGFSGEAEIQGLANLTGLAARPNVYHGIDVRASSEVVGLKVWYFHGNGINLDSNIGVPQNGATPNANNSRVTRNSIYHNHGNGVYNKGINSNQSLIENNDASSNFGAGFGEFSFLGNTYNTNHTSFNWFGGIFADGDVNVSQFFAEYAEGGQPSSVCDAMMIVWGGNHGNNWNSSSSCGRFSMEGSYLTPTLSRFDNNTGTKTVAFMASNSQPNTMFGFGAGEEDFNVFSTAQSVKVRTFAYQMGYDQLATGWYSLYFGGNYSADQANSVLAMSGSEAAEGGGQLWLKSGFYAGTQGSTRRKWSYVSSVPTSGTVSLGDIFWNNASNAGKGAPIGWIVSTAGTIGSGAVLTPFGESPVLTGSASSVDPPSVNAQEAHEFTVTVTGATTNDVVTCNITGGTADAGLVWSAYVSAADTVTVRLANFTSSAVDGASRNWKCKVIQ